jgi:hypothetical protein
MQEQSGGEPKSVFFEIAHSSGGIEAGIEKKKCGLEHGCTTYSKINFGS